MRKKLLLWLFSLLLVVGFASADWYYNPATGQIDYYEPVSGANFGDLANVTLTGVANGNVLYYNGTRWVNLAIGANTEVLTLVAGIPAWAAAGAPGAHAATHAGGGADPADHDTLANYVAGEHLGLPSTIAATLTDHNLAAHTGLGLAIIAHAMATHSDEDTYNISTSGTAGTGEITVADGGGINLQEDITFTGATTENLIKFPDNLADALNFKEGANSYMQFITTDDEEDIIFYKSVDILHTAAHADDHALEIDVDAASLGDVKAIDIDYITGQIDTGQDEGVILVNIDETIADGGDVFALEVLSTDGSANIYGVKVGPVVHPIHQDSGVFINATLGTDNTPSTNVPNMVDGILGNTTAIFTNNGEYIIIGANAAFQDMELVFSTVASKSINPTFWYSIDGGSDNFTQFTPVDGTDGCKHTGVISWDASDLVGHVADATTGKFDIKMIRTKAGAMTTPVLGYAKTAATTEYVWDKDGDVNIRKLAISTVVNAGTDTDKFLVLDGSDNVDYRTGAEVLSDIGGSADAFTLKVDAGATADYFGVAGGDGLFRFTANQFTMADGGNFVTLSLADHATARTALGLAIGTDVQAWDTDLDTYAGISPSANVQTLLSNATFALFLADLSTTAAAAFDWGGQNLTNVGSIAPTSIDCGGVITAASYIGIEDTNELRFYDNGNYVGFEPGALEANQIWVLPIADGANTQVMQTDGAGTLTWVANASGSMATDALWAAQGDLAYGNADDTGVILSFNYDGDILRLNATVPYWDTPGIANTNPVVIDDDNVADDEYARFTANGLESRTAAEVLSNIGARPIAVFHDEGAEGGAFTIDWTNGEFQKVTITGVALDITFTEPATPGRYLLMIVQGDGDDTLDWEHEVSPKWPGGVEPTLSVGAADVDFIGFFYDGGTTYYGLFNGNFE